ncbi:uncharacterized protein (TIGR02001 family) [Sphingomonas sp. UYAg733]
MRISTLSLGALLLAATATPAFAQDAAAPAPPPAITVTGGATIVSDYRFRGISQTDKKVAVQGTFTVSHESGFYLTVWGSSIDDYVAAGSDQEVDFIAGYSHTIDGFKLDGGILYYYYPGGGHLKTDFFEPYADVSYTAGPVTGKVTVNYAPKQDALSLDGIHKEDNVYLAGDLSTGIPNTPIALSAHLGHTFGPSYLSAGYKDYTDWGVGATYTWNHLTAGISYVDTNKDTFIIDGPGKLRNITSSGVVASLGVAF